MDLAILGLIVSSVSAMGAILAAVSFWVNRGKVEERADQALARAKEGTIAMTGSCLRSPLSRSDRGRHCDRQDFGGDKYRCTGLSGKSSGSRDRADEHSFRRTNQRIDRLLMGEKREAAARQARFLWLGAVPRTIFLDRLVCSPIVIGSGELRKGARLDRPLRGGRCEGEALQCG